jgi:hypothetical protein
VISFRARPVTNAIPLGVTCSGGREVGIRLVPPPFITGVQVLTPPLYGGVEATIKIDGHDFGTVKGYLNFCVTDSGSCVAPCSPQTPCVPNLFSQSIADADWQPNSILAKVTLPANAADFGNRNPDDQQAVWYATVNLGDGWQPGGDVSNPVHGRFQVARPVITSMVPPYAILGGTVEVSIAGISLDQASSVNIYGNGCPGSGCGLTAAIGDAPSATSVTPLITLAPDAKSGTYQVSVTSGLIESNRLTFTAADRTPVITFVTQEDLRPNDHASISIHGSSLGPPCSGNLPCSSSSVRICKSTDSLCGSSDVSVTSITAWSDTRIDATVTAAAAATGFYDVQLTSSGTAGTGFLPAAQGRTSPQSNRGGPIAVTNQSNVTLHVTTSNNTVVNQGDCVYTWIMHGTQLGAAVA